MFLSFFKKWYSILLLIIVTSSVTAIILHKTSSINWGGYQNSRDVIEVMSWLFSGVVSIISFLSIFVGFVYDNKLVTASTSLQQIYRPYGLDSINFRKHLIDYKQAISKGMTLNSIYWIILITSFCSMSTWIISLKVLYNIFPVVFKVYNIPNLLLLLMWIVFSLLLLFLLVYLNLINNNKNPLGKGYLPKPEQLLDINFLMSQDIDLDEIFLKSTPVLELYKNGNGSSQATYELNIVFLNPISNYKYIIKVKSQERSAALFKCYGYNSLKKSVNQKDYHTLDNNISEQIYNSLINSTVEAKFYTNNNVLISRLNLAFNREGDKIYTQPIRSITHVSIRDIESGLVSPLSVDSHQLHV